MMAIETFALDITGLACLDAGASTGGFTDCLLQHDATHVYEMDVGKNQLYERFRDVPRVISLEGVNLCASPPSLIPEPVDLVVADVSCISLTLVLPDMAGVRQRGSGRDQAPVRARPRQVLENQRMPLRFR
jgi:23S rRNA (cytidine1920-2'-O)/16S rRNA (cytidine1409-2'-O)-methyltransferase